MTVLPRPGFAQFALFAGLVANVTAQVFLFTTLPALGRQMGFSDLQSGAILSASALILIVASPVWGSFSERIGRRPVVLLALMGAGLGPIAFSLITSTRLDGGLNAGAALILFVTARLLQAVFVSGLLPGIQAYIADITDTDGRVGGMGLIGAAYGIGAIGGAALAWWLGGADPASPFLLTSGLLGVAFALVVWLAPEPARHRAGGAPADPLIRRVWPFACITLLVFASYGIVQQVLSLRLQDLMGFSVQDSISKAGVALLVTAFAMVLVQGFVVRLLRWPPQRLLIAGALLGAGAMLLCGFMRDYRETVAVLTLFGVALGLLIPGNLAALSLRAGGNAQGKAAGINMIGQGLGLAIGPLAGAALHQLSPAIPFATAAVLLACAAALTAKAIRIRTPDVPETAAEQRS